MLFTFLRMWNTRGTTCWNLKTQTNPVSPQACLDSGHFCWRPCLHRNWTSCVLSSQTDTSAPLLLRSHSPHLSLHHNLKREHSRLYRAPLQGLHDIPDKAFQLAATLGNSTRVFWIQYLIASHPLPFRPLSQVTTNRIHTFPEIYDSYHSDPAYFMIT